MKLLVWVAGVVLGWGILFVAFVLAPIIVAKVIFAISMLGLVTCLAYLAVVWIGDLKSFLTQCRIARHRKARAGWMYERSRLP